MKQYLDLVREVLDGGTHSTSRAGDVIRKFAPTPQRYPVSRDAFPLLTTKKVSLDNVRKELHWFLRGETNINTLGCHIWDEWADEDGALGPIYGKQWRDWNGTDQIAECIRRLVEEPDSRRNIVASWNVTDLPAMALPPCHCFFQLSVTNGVVDLALYQRSADIALGVPYNIASYALLLLYLCEASGLAPGDLIHFIGDAHIYVNHIEGLQRQLLRAPRQLPRLIGDELVDYNPHPFIKFPIAV